MVIHTHVDDLCVALRENSELANRVLERITRELHMVKNTNMVYCGKALEVLPDRIVIRQPTAAAVLDGMDLPLERRSMPDALLEPQELSQYRS
eukprot:11159194-Lingulodinium_polyedra.AAC.1